MASVITVGVVEQQPKRGNADDARPLDPTRVLRRVYRAALRSYERALHPRRHLTLSLRLKNQPRPQRILVICHGNICRSPYLQAVLQRDLPDVAVTSAGFVGSGRPAPQVSVAVCIQRGLDLSRHRSQPITRSKVAAADLVIVMDAEQARRVAGRFRASPDRIVIAGDLDPKFDTSRSIRDPWKESADVFRESFDRLDRCADNLVRLLKG